MNKVKEIFILESIDDNPIYEGFGVDDIDQPSLIGRESILDDITPGYDSSKIVRKWKPVYLKNLWSPLLVSGRVAPFNDYPCVDGFPAFSKKACDALFEVLKENGELLTLASKDGDYFLFNITTIVDVLDVGKSKCTFWCDPPTTAVDIESYEFIEKKLLGLSIFRIYENPIEVFVTDKFVKKVFSSGLNGFLFKKIWPLPKGRDWREYNENILYQDRLANEKLTQHSMVVIMFLSGEKPSGAEKKQLTTLENELDAILKIRNIDEPYYGKYEGSDIVNSEYRLFLSCPDVDELEDKLSIWLTKLEWDNHVIVLKRYGDMRDVEAKEVQVQYSHRGVEPS